TWSLVRMYPSSRMVSPLPLPPVEPLRTKRVTTVGSTASAIEIPGHAGAFASALKPDDDDPDPDESSLACAIRPPTRPATTEMTRMTAAPMTSVRISDGG